MQRPRLLVPLGAIATVLSLGPALGPVALAADPTVVVLPGDTLIGISKRHHVPIADLVQLNGLADPNRIYAGQTLRIGTEAPAPAPAVVAPPAPPAATASAAQVHVIAHGETLTSIARRYGVSIEAIVAANGIADASRIYAGRSISIPGAAAPTAPTPAPAAATPAPAAPAPSAQAHVIARGETLTSIARRYGVTIEAVVAANGIGDASRIYAGQQLVIPGSAAAPSAAPAPAPAMPPAMLAIVTGRAAVGQIISEEAATLGVPAAFAMAVAWQESGWQQGVVSTAGAVGVMQLLPSTAAWVGESMLGAAVDITDTRANVRAGVRLLAHYLGRYGGNKELALAAYYQGQRSVDTHGIYPVTRGYIASILVLERLFGG